MDVEALALERARTKARAKNTERAYKQALKGWEAYAKARGAAVLPIEPHRLIGYLEELHMLGRSRSTLALVLSALAVADARARVFRTRQPMLALELEHLDALGSMPRYEQFASIRQHPDVSDWWKAYLKDSRAARGAPALPRSGLLEIVRALRKSRSLETVRDVAILTMGWLGALRRGEIAALDRDDVVVTADTLDISIRAAKTDQQRLGQVVVIERQSSELCAMAAWREYELARASGEIPAFTRAGARLSGKAIHEIVMRRSRLVGLQCTGHSLRVGLVTEAAGKGVPERVIERHGRWNSPKMVRHYIRFIDARRENPTRGLT
jgi:integrase